jgi:hypothetical protein
MIADITLPFAYIGPGGGMEFIGYAAALIAMILGAFLSIILWPVYKVRSMIRGKKQPAPSTETPAEPAPISPPADKPAE